MNKEYEEKMAKRLKEFYEKEFDKKFIEKEFGGGKGVAAIFNLVIDLMIDIKNLQKDVKKLSDLVEGKRRKYSRRLKKEDKLFIYNRDKNICQKCKQYFENTAFLQVDHIDKKSSNISTVNFNKSCCRR